MGRIDSGDTAFVLISGALVSLMTPGLAFFYGGLVRRKNVLAIMMQSFVSMGWTTVLWYLYGYSLCFSGDWHASSATSTTSACAALAWTRLPRIRPFRCSSLSPTK